VTGEVEEAFADLSLALLSLHSDLVRPYSKSTAFDISYGSGKATGYAATETISLGGQAVQNQAFGSSLLSASSLIPFVLNLT
jgi:hypothetical protein